MQSTPTKEKLFLIAATSYVVLGILCNLAGGKLVPFPLTGGLVSCSLFIYPITYFITSLVAATYGGKKARLLIYLGFAMTICMHCFASLLIAIPFDPISEEFQTSLKTLFSFSGLSLIASLLTFVASQLMDVTIFLKMKGPLWLRLNAATFLSQIVDSFVFNFILFWGLMGWSFLEVFDIFISAIVLKMAFSILLTPLFYAAISASKRFALRSVS